MSDDFNDDEDITAIALLIAQGAVPGVGISEVWEDIDGEVLPRSRRINKPRSFDSALARFSQHYFSGNSTYDETVFERRFRVPRVVLDRVCQALLVRSIFKHRTEATSKNGICPLIRVIAALRILAYGKSYDEIDKLCEMSRTSARESFLSFITEVIAMYGAEYIRAPREEDYRRILGINSRRGFPGCVGSWDCQHWEWKNCPVAWARQFKGKLKQPTIVLEAVADGELWIWACHFGKPGSLNDINILDSSPIITVILQVNLLPGFEYEINENKHHHLCFLVDGIYPPYSIFINTIAESTTRKEKAFSTAQEAMRKDVEWAFGVLVSRWALLAKPCTAMERDLAAKIMQTSIILLNMIVEARRNGYKSKLYMLAKIAVEKGFFVDKIGDNKEFKWNTQCDVLRGSGDPCGTRWAAHITGKDSRMKDAVLHHALKLNLINHIWDMHGHSD